MNCENDTNVDGDCPKCTNPYIMGFMRGLYKSEGGYYLKYDDKWYLWCPREYGTTTAGWICLNDKWEFVLENDEVLITKNNESHLESKLELVEYGCFDPKEYRLEMGLVKW